MEFNRTTFFVILLSLISIPFLLQKILWLADSEKTNGIMGFVGKSYSGQIVHVYSVIKFNTPKETIWFNGNDNILFKPGERVPVRYLTKDPHEARIDVFPSIWGDTIVYGGIPLVILLIVIVHPLIVPYGSRIRIQIGKPFICIIQRQEKIGSASI